jgi:hypothetical protein
MKSLSEIVKTLEEFEKTFGFSAVGAIQGSGVWFQLKLGVLSASNADCIVAGKTTDKRYTYMSSLVAQVCTGIMEEINSKYLEWGSSHEDAARSYYEFSTGHTVKQLPFVFKDGSFREGCSPDGIVTETKGVEIKCPYNSVHFIKFLSDNKIKGEYDWQTQYTLRVMDADEWDFVQYDPRMKTTPLHIITVKRDAEKQKQFDDLVPAFIEDMDKMLAKLGVKFGDQWHLFGDKIAGARV